MGFNPEDIAKASYDEPKKPKKTGFVPSDITGSGEGNSAQDALMGAGSEQGYEFDEFGFQPKTNADNYKLRAQNQSWLQQAGRTIGNTVANIPLGLVEGLGYTAELFDKANDYTNPVIELMNEWRNPFGEVYRENPS
jgi:hypothetical protein